MQAVIAPLPSDFDPYKAPFTLYFFVRERYGNVPFWPSVYTETFSHQASYANDFIRKHYNVYTVPFS